MSDDSYKPTSKYLMNKNCEPHQFHQI